jgi:hypothetical protein
VGGMVSSSISGTSIIQHVIGSQNEAFQQTFFDYEDGKTFKFIVGDDTSRMLQAESISRRENFVNLKYSRLRRQAEICLS